jgi:hypothetical protein
MAGIPLRWKYRAHKGVSVLTQGAIGAVNEALGEGGIGGSGVGARTVAVAVGGIGAAMGSQIAADVFWAGLGSAAEEGGRVAVSMIKSKRGDAKAEPAKAEPAKDVASGEEPKAERKSSPQVAPVAAPAPASAADADPFAMFAPEIRERLERALREAKGEVQVPVAGGSAAEKRA